MDYGKWLLISQVALYPAFGLCYIPFILILPRILGVRGIYFSQPAADILTLLVCVLDPRYEADRFGQYGEEGSVPILISPTPPS